MDNWRSPHKDHTYVTPPAENRRGNPRTLDFNRGAGQRGRGSRGGVRGRGKVPFRPTPQPSPFQELGTIPVSTTIVDPATSETSDVFLQRQYDIVKDIKKYDIMSQLEVIEKDILRRSMPVNSSGSPFDEFIIGLKRLFVTSMEEHQSEENPVPAKILKLFDLILDNLYIENQVGSQSWVFQLVSLLFGSTRLPNEYSLFRLYSIRDKLQPDSFNMLIGVPHKTILEFLLKCVERVPVVIACGEGKTMFSNNFTSFSHIVAILVSDFITFTTCVMAQSGDAVLNELSQQILCKIIEASAVDAMNDNVTATLCKSVDATFKKEVELGTRPVLSIPILICMLGKIPMQKDHMSTLFKEELTTCEEREMNTILSSATEFFLEDNLKSVLKSPCRSLFQYLIKDLSSLLLETKNKRWDYVEALATSNDVLMIIKLSSILVTYHSYELKDAVGALLNVSLRCLAISLDVECHLFERAKTQQTLNVGEWLEASIFGKIIFLIRGLIQAESLNVPDEYEIGADPNTGQLNWIMTHIVEVFQLLELLSTSNLLCIMVDTVAHLGNSIYDYLSFETQEELLDKILFLAHSSQSKDVNVVSKCGHTLAILSRSTAIFGSQKFTEQLTWGILDSVQHKSKDIRASWAWTLGEFTQGMIFDSSKYDMLGTQQLIQLLKSVEVVSNDVMRVRYNGYRAAGSLFKLLTPEQIENETLKESVRTIIDILLAQVGSGTDYKARWNAAYALGCVFENEDVANIVNESRVCLMIKCLTLWVRQSQNFKERIQCAVAISKANRRKYFGNEIASTWKKLMLAGVKLPSDSLNLVHKLRIELILALATIASVLEPTDMESLEAIILESSEEFRNMGYNARGCVNPDQVELVARAEDRIKSLKFPTPGCAAAAEILKETFGCITQMGSCSYDFLFS